MRLRELVDEGPFTLEVVTGEARLDDRIRWVHISDLPDPAPYLRGGELILTNGLWHRSAQDSHRFVQSLAAKGAPAVGIALFGSQRLPSGLELACRDAGVLLLALPDVPFMDLTEYIISRLMREREQQSIRAIALDSELARRVTSGEGPLGILDVVARELGADCWILERNGRVHSPRTIAASVVDAVWRAAFGRRTPPSTTTMTTIDTGAGRRVIVDVGEVGPGDVRTVAVIDAEESAIRSSAPTSTDLLDRYLPMVLRDSAPLRQARELLADAGADTAILRSADEGVLAAQGGFSVLEATISMDGGTQEAADALSAAIRRAGHECLTAATGPIPLWPSSAPAPPGTARLKRSAAKPWPIAS